MKGQPFKRALDVLKGVAPTAVTALAGPYAPLAATVMRKVLGAGEGDDLEAAVIAAASDPETAVKLKQIEAEMKAQEQQLGIRFAELEVEDRKDARALARDRSLVPWLVLTALFVGGYFAVLTFVLWGVFYGIEAEMLDTAMLSIAATLLGVLTGEVPRIMSWWFGSSSGSRQKTELMATGPGRH